MHVGLRLSPWALTLLLVCWSAWGPAGEGCVAWSVLLGLWRVAESFFSKLQICQDCANSLILSLSLSVVIAHIGVGYKICVGIISVSYGRYLIALHWTFHFPMSLLLLATVPGVRAGLSGALLWCSLRVGAMDTWIGFGGDCREQLNIYWSTSTTWLTLWCC